jgi:DNA mismatch endonuclease, patch repair protein
MDVVDSATRSRMMAGIRSKDTKPEMAVRRYLHARGFRYRLHARDLPGSPDLVLPKYRTAILVHGCFWHRHSGCRFATTPTSNVERWDAKFRANIARDAKKLASLEEAGWRVIVVWECELRQDPTERLQRLAEEITEQNSPSGSSPADVRVPGSRQSGSDCNERPALLCSRS